MLQFVYFYSKKKERNAKSVGVLYFYFVHHAEVEDHIIENCVSKTLSIENTERMKVINMIKI